MDVTEVKFPASPGPGNEREAAGSKQDAVALALSGWQIGQALFLQHENVRHNVRLIGYVEGKSLLVTAPTKDGKFQLVRDGQVFVVRTFAGKKAYAFTASVLKAAHVPHPYLHLSFPAQVSCAVVRRGERVATELVAAVSLPQVQEPTAMIIRDVSLGGVAGTLREAIGIPGEEFRLKFKVTVAQEDIYLDLPVTLRSLQPDGPASCRHGFEFGRLAVSDRLALGAFLHETRFEQS